MCIRDSHQRVRERLRHRLVGELEVQQREERPELVVHVLGNRLPQLRAELREGPLAEGRVFSRVEQERERRRLGDGCDGCVLDESVRAPGDGVLEPPLFLFSAALELRVV